MTSHDLVFRKLQRPERSAHPPTENARPLLAEVGRISASIHVWDEHDYTRRSV